MIKNQNNLAYVAVRFKGLESKTEVERLCSLVEQAGFATCCFVRDKENYQKTYDDLKSLWRDTLEEMNKCDYFIVDISDQPTGGRVVEIGIAYALNMPIIILIKKGVDYKNIFTGLAHTVVPYVSDQDITDGLKSLNLK